MEETVDLVPVVPAMEYIAPTSAVNDSLLEPGPSEFSAFEFLQNVIQEKQMEVDRRVRMLMREHDNFPRGTMAAKMITGPAFLILTFIYGKATGIL